MDDGEVNGKIKTFKILSKLLGAYIYSINTLRRFNYHKMMVRDWGIFKAQNVG